MTRIIEPLASRCAKFRFQALPPTSMKARLTEIAKAEHCYDNDDDDCATETLLDDILRYSNGDMRRAVTTLQSVHATGMTLDASDVAEMAGLPPVAVVDELWTSCHQTSFLVLQSAVDNVTAAGFSGQMLIKALLDRLLEKGNTYSNTLNEISRAEIAIRIAEAESNMIEGADEYLQLMTVATLIMTCCKNSNKEQ